METSSIFGGILGFFAFVILSFMASRGCDPQVICWYSSYANNNFAAPSFRLTGRTAGVLSTDLSGPVFQSQAELESYINTHRLTLCGQAR